MKRLALIRSARIDAENENLLTDERYSEDYGYAGFDEAGVPNFHDNDRRQKYLANARLIERCERIEKRYGSVA